MGRHRLLRTPPRISSPSWVVPRSGLMLGGSVPVASFTVTKLRWLLKTNPRMPPARPRFASRTIGSPGSWPDATDGGSLTTDRSDASGTGYWSPATGTYRPDLLRLALGHSSRVPVVLDRQSAGGSRPRAERCSARSRRQRRCGTRGRRRPSATSSSQSAHPSWSAQSARRRLRTLSGIVAGFASATGQFLPPVCTLNAARVLDAAAAMLRVDHVRALRTRARRAAGSPTDWSSCHIWKANAPPIGPTPLARLHGLTLRTSTPRTWPERQSRACCAGWPTVLTLWNATAPASIASSWWVAARDPRRSGSSPRRYSATR